MNYAGGKGGSGVVQKIINQIRPHDVYIEAFVGGGAVLRCKKAAAVSVAIDLDSDVVKMSASIKIPGLIVIEGDAISYLPRLLETYWNKKVVVYADPPYLGYTRSGSRPIYKHEMMNEEKHLELLEVLKSLECDVLLSGYQSKLYKKELKDWRCISYQSMTRGGFAATESLWMNYPEPFELHDYRYLGDDFRERERITRKKKRWLSRLRKMKPIERYAILDAIETLENEQVI